MHFIVPSFQPVLLLSAPAALKALPEPKVAGLLPASTQPQPYFVFDRPSSRAAKASDDEFLRKLGPIRSREEMNADLVAIWFGWEPPSRTSARSVHHA